MFSKIRARLAYDLTISVLGLIALISVVAIFAAAYLDHLRGNGQTHLLDTLRLLLTSLLPVLGAWVGTVLAHYYGRETLEAATRLNRAANPREAETASVATIMIPIVSANILKLAPAKALEDVTIEDIAKTFEVTKDGKPFERLPILNTDSACVAMIHQSTFKEVLALAGGKADQRTLHQLQAAAPGDAAKLQSALAKFTGTIAYIGLKATLADARTAMAVVPGAEDAIVTATGAKHEPAIGWVTNEDLLAAIKIR